MSTNNIVFPLRDRRKTVLGSQDEIQSIKPGLQSEQFRANYDRMSETTRAGRPFVIICS